MRRLRHANVHFQTALSWTGDFINVNVINRTINIRARSSFKADIVSAPPPPTNFSILNEQVFPFDFDNLIGRS